MYDDEKVYSIDLGEDLVIEKDDGKPSGTRARHGGLDPAAPKPRLVLRSRASSQAQKGARGGKMASRRLHFALLVPLVFLAGPLAVLLTPEGRRKRDWVIFGSIMGLGWIAMALGHAKVAAWMGPGRLQAPTVVLAATFLVGGFTAWARGVALAGGDNRPADHRLPLPMRRAWGTGFLGLVAPGLGLLAAGRNRRASAVVWLGWLPVAALAFATMGRAWWPGAVPSDGFEKALLASWALVGAGALAWLVQALEGARLVPWEGYRYQSRRGEILGLVAVLGILVLMVTGDPSPVARQLGRQARAFQAEGYRIVPLAMVRTAAVMDPGRTDYAIMAVDLYEQMGRPGLAAAIRRRLDGDLASYLARVRAEEERAAREAARSAYLAGGSAPAWFGPDPFAGVGSRGGVSAEKENPGTVASGSSVDD